MSSSRSIFQSFQSNKQGLPVSAADQVVGGGMRRRLSSLSLKIQQPSSMSNYMNIMSGSLRRSKSMMSSEYAYAGNSIRKWWDWGWEWILSRKPTLAQDLEMNEQEMAAIGSHNKGSWRHVVFKVKLEVGRLLRGSDSHHNMVLPQTVRSNSSY